MENPDNPDICGSITYNDLMHYGGMVVKLDDPAMLDVLAEDINHLKMRGFGDAIEEIRDHFNNHLAECGACDREYKAISTTMEIVSPFLKEILSQHAGR